MLRKLMSVGLFGYDLKPAEELAWAGVISAGAELGRILVGPPTFDPSQVTDWHTWVTSVVFAGLARAFIAGVLGKAKPKDGRTE